MSALWAVLTYGGGSEGDIISEVRLPIILTAILFVIGAAAFSRVRLRAEL